MFADIAQSNRAQQGITNRVCQHIGIGMTGQPARMRDYDSAQNQRARIAKLMRIESEANSKVIHLPPIICARRLKSPPRFANRRGR